MNPEDFLFMAGVRRKSSERANRCKNDGNWIATINCNDPDVDRKETNLNIAIEFENHVSVTVFKSSDRSEVGAQSLRSMDTAVLFDQEECFADLIKTVAIYKTFHWFE